MHVVSGVGEKHPEGSWIPVAVRGQPKCFKRNRESNLTRQRVELFVVVPDIPAQHTSQASLIKIIFKMCVKPSRDAI